MRARDARLRDVNRRRTPVPVERRALPTRERLRRAGKDVARRDSGQITMRDSPLERAFARGALTAEQYSAGQNCPAKARSCNSEVGAPTRLAGKEAAADMAAAGVLSRPPRIGQVPLCPF